MNDEDQDFGFLCLNGILSTVSALKISNWLACNLRFCFNFSDVFVFTSKVRLAASQFKVTMQKPAAQTNDNINRWHHILTAAKLQNSKQKLSVMIFKQLLLM